MVTRESLLDALFQLVGYVSVHPTREGVCTRLAPWRPGPADPFEAVFIEADHEQEAALLIVELLKSENGEFAVDHIRRLQLRLLSIIGSDAGLSGTYKALVDSAVTSI
jgi:hypothetical protein